MPVHGTYRGYDIVSMPLPSSGGVVLLETLNILEGFPLPDMKQGSAPSLHLLIEAMKRAYADRAHYLGDPAFVTAPVATLIDQGLRRQAARRHRSRPRHAVDRRARRRRRRTKAATPRIFRWSIARGNAVSNTYTLNFPYGVGLVADGTGVLLNNELDDFTAAPAPPMPIGLVGFEANLPAPGKRPLSSMTPTIVLKDGKAGAGDGLARRQPHHLRGAAGDRRRARLSHGRRRRGRGARGCIINGCRTRSGSSTAFPTMSSPN